MKGATVHPIDVEAYDPQKPEPALNNEVHPEGKGSDDNGKHIIFAQGTEGSPKRKYGSILFIDTGKLIKTNDDGSESVELVSSSAAVKQDYYNSFDSEDDGASYLSPIVPFTPEDEGSFKVVSGIQIAEPTSSGQPRSVHSATSSFKGGLPADLLKEITQRKEEGGSAVFTQNYGEGSQNYGQSSQKFSRLEKPGGSREEMLKRRLSFADDGGRGVLANVTETEESYYQIKRRSLKEKLVVFCGLLFLFAFVVSAVVYMVLNP